MKPYPKIETLFARNKETFVVDQTALRNPVLGDISAWYVTEKVDGMNIRIHYDPQADRVILGGRSDKAQIPADLVATILGHFTPERMRSILHEGSDPDTRITLYGEGYGGSIQKGSAYRMDKAFVLFDVLFQCGRGAADHSCGVDEWWAPEAAVTAYAETLDCARAPFLGIMTLPEIVDLVRNGFESVVAKTPMMAEGIVAKPRSPLFTPKGRIVIKLKTSDFIPGKR